MSKNPEFGEDSLPNHTSRQFDELEHLQIDKFIHQKNEIT